MSSAPRVAPTPIPAAAAVGIPSLFLLLEPVAVAVVSDSITELPDAVVVAEASEFCVFIALAVCTEVCFDEVVLDSASGGAISVGVSDVSATEDISTVVMVDDEGLEEILLTVVAALVGRAEASAQLSCPVLETSVIEPPDR